MKVVDLSECYKVGDQSLFIVGRTCTDLLKLDLTCTKGDRSSITTQGEIFLSYFIRYANIIMKNISEILDSEFIIGVLTGYFDAL